MPTSDAPQRGRLLAAISTAMVRLHAEYYGKGPTKAKSYYWDDLVVCVLQDGFTTIEKTLVAAGEEDAVRHIRATFQRAMREKFVGAVEELTGRKVISFLSSTGVDPDRDVETFLLEPLPEDAVSPAAS